jgi:rod shape determining protein RodA
MQFIWIMTALILAIAILFVINPKAYSVLPPPIYLGVCLLLVAVIFLGKEVNGSNSWFQIGPVSFQPAEVSKISTSLFLAYIMSKYNFRLGNMRDALSVALTILVPMAIIVMEKETGSALVYCGFIFLLYREGLSGWVLVFGILSIVLFVVTLAASSLTAIIILFVLAGIINGIYTRKLMQHLVVIAPTAILLGFLPAIAEKLDFLFYWLFGFESPELVAFPMTSLGAVGAALGLVPKFQASGLIDGNAIAVFTAMGMCWSGYLSTHTAMLDSLGYRELTSKAIIAHTVGGLCAGIVAHWLFVVVNLI